MSESNAAPPLRLRRLAEFRYQLRKFLSVSETISESSGISVQQYQLLQVVATVPEDRGASISYLAERMFLRHNSAVELVDRAVRSGLVQRQSDEEDLRRSLVVLTPEGSAILDRLVTDHLAQLDKNGNTIMRAMELLLASGRRPREPK